MTRSLKYKTISLGAGYGRDLQESVLALDIETTGLDYNSAGDEILQLAMTADDGTALYNSYFKPIEKIVGLKRNSFMGFHRGR